MLLASQTDSGGIGVSLSNACVFMTSFYLPVPSWGFSVGFFLSEKKMTSLPRLGFQDTTIPSF